MLSNFQFGGQALLQIFLLGQPEFRDALAQPRFEQLRQRVIATHHLTAMSMEETGPYVMHRLACAGWKGAPRFSQSAFEAFHRLSGGIPRRLNMLAARVLLQGAIERLVDIDAEVVEDVAADLASESIMPAEPTPGGQPVPFAYPEASPWPVPAPQAVMMPQAAAAPPPPEPFQPPPIQPPPPIQQQAWHTPASSPPPIDPAPAPVEPTSWYAPAPPQPRFEPASPPTASSVSHQPASNVVGFGRPEGFTVLPEHVPPPSIPQPPRYDGVVPAEAAPPPAAPPIPVTRLRPVDFVPASVSEAPPAAQPVEDMAARNAELEARLAEQEKILRRTLSLLVEWVESEEPRPSGAGDSQNVA